METVQAERERRREALKKCEKCKGYAQDAVNAYDFNDPEGKIRGAFDGYEWPPMPCGFSGDAWSSDFKGHVRWCMGASDADTKRETENREALRQICWTCRQYAHRAVVAYRNVWDKCKSFWSNPSMSGEDWSVDHQQHLRWCLGLAADRRQASLDSASGRRGTVVQACMAKVQAPLMVQPAAKAELRKKVPAATKKETRRAATRPVQAARQSTDIVKSSSAKKQSAGGGNSAMDRLGGGSSGTAGSDTARGGKPRSGSSAAAPASSGGGAGSGGGGGGVAPPATGVNRNAIGAGGSPERIR